MGKNDLKRVIADALCRAAGGEPPHVPDTLRLIEAGTASETGTPGAAAPMAAAGGLAAPTAPVARTPSAAAAVPCLPAPTPERDDRDDDETVPLNAILDNVKDSILTVDTEGRVLSINTAGTKLFGAAPDAVLGRPLESLIPTLGGAGELARMASRVDDTIVDFAPHSVQARHASGDAFSAEVTVSRVQQESGRYFVLCLRDVTERLRDVQALRDSEARYRALVENAPEAIVVLDVETNRFVDANENAAQLFRVAREELLSMSPRCISPQFQADGSPSFGLQRGYVERALKGGRPVFEWLHRDAEGRDIPCEVRFIRLPSSTQQLIRASIIDVAARRRADALAFGERRVLELIAGNASLEQTLDALVRLAEQVHPELAAAVTLLEAGSARIRMVARGRLPDPLAEALADLPVGLHAGACGAAASLGRQVVIRDVTADRMWADLESVAVDNGILACCSTPIVTSGGRIHGTLALFFETARGPTTDELDLAARLTQLAGIAIRRTQDETALRESEARFRALFENVVDGVFQITREGRTLSTNPALRRMLGYDPDEVTSFDVIPHFVNVADRERLWAELTAHGRVRNFEYRLRRRNGSVIIVVENSRLVHDDEGRLLYCEGTMTDVTQRKAAEHALYKEKERAQVTLKSIGDAVVTTDAEGRVEYLNPVAEQLTGWERRAAQGKHIDEIVELTDENGDALADAPVQRCLDEGRIVTLAGNAVLVGRDGTTVPIQDSAAPIQDRDGRVVGAVMVFHDVSHARQLHRKLSYHASHDSLTGLINRREFEERLSSALRAVKADGERGFALLYLDLDQFKVVNDTCGHAAGDLLLRQLSEVLQSRVRASDVLARLGGDEFAALLTDCTMDDATELADKLRESVARFRFSWRDGTMQVGVSIGIVPVTAASESVGGIMSAADVACYVAKDHGRNRIHVYEEGDAAERHQEMQWVARINAARDQERLELYFQPIVPIGSTRGEVPQFELLLRLRDEQGRIVPPASFIPAAERYNLMPSLDRWVIEEVLSEHVYRDDSSSDPYMLAINLSGTTLNDARFLDFLVEELNSAQLGEGALCFEITETAAIANLGQVVSFMQTLRARGCRFSLDDFGTGLSSLTYLKNLPVDYVKIDGQFIRNVSRDPVDRSVVEAIAQMARAFDIGTIAERVENRQVLDRLAEIGIGFAQGYFVSVPRPVSELPVGRRAHRASA